MLSILKLLLFIEAREEKEWDLINPIQIFYKIDNKNSINQRNSEKISVIFRCAFWCCKPNYGDKNIGSRPNFKRDNMETYQLHKLNRIKGGCLVAM